MPNERARHLRKNLTDTERFVWHRLRKRQLAHFKFRRQMPLGPFIVDFISLERRVILELDGGQHTEQAEEDQKRTEWLQGQGFRVLRFWNHEVWKDWDAIEQVLWEALEAVPPTPTLPRQGGGRKS
jgi:very-short-patch-repair endonuclease